MFKLNFDAYVHSLTRIIYVLIVPATRIVKSVRKTLSCKRIFTQVQFTRHRLYIECSIARSPLHIDYSRKRTFISSSRNNRRRPSSILFRVRILIKNERVSQSPSHAPFLHTIQRVGRLLYRTTQRQRSNADRTLCILFVI